MPLTFHLFDSIAQDSDPGYNKTKDTSYTIFLFGSTSEGRPVRLTVNGFEPFFYIELPETKSAFADFLENMNKQLAYRDISTDTVRFEECSKSSMYGYSGGKKMSLVKISTKTRRVFYEMKRIFLDDRSRPIFKLYKGGEESRVFDANLDPMLRFFHLRNVQPCGWITADCEVDEDDTIYNDLVAQTDTTGPTEFMGMFIIYMDHNLKKIFNKPKDIIVADAIIQLFRNRENIDIFNKKALYIYIREMTDSSTPQITRTIKKLKKIYKEQYNHYYTHGYIKTN